jgi:ribosomal protein S21
MVKVFQKNLSPNASMAEKEIAFKKMFSIFKKAVVDSGILQEYKKREFYESPGEKRRRKKKESKNQLLKAKLRENFPERYGDA